MSLDVSKKQKKQLKKLQRSAADLWAEQQRVAAEAATVAREAGRQLNTFGKKQVLPTLEEQYHERVEPYVDRARPYVDKGVRVSRGIFNGLVVPAATTVATRASRVWDATADQRAVLAQRIGLEAPAPAKKKSKAGPVIAIILGVAAAVGVLYAAWQTLRADDELWVADDPLSTPES